MMERPPFVMSPWTEVVELWRVVALLMSLPMAMTLHLQHMEIVDNDRETRVIFRNVPCQPVSQEHLHNMLGDEFNARHMSLTAPPAGDDHDDDAETGGPMAQKYISDAFSSRKRRDTQSSIFTSDTDLFESQFNRDAVNTFQSRKMLSHHKDRDDDELSRNERRHPVRSKSSKTLKRFLGIQEDILGQDTAASDSSSKRRHRRRSHNKDKDLPWKCKLQKKWKRMDQGVFPPYVQTGKCSNEQCMYGFYSCTPKKYVIRVLQRDTSNCNPIPVTGNNTTLYEEAWTFTRMKVVVYCDCGSERPMGHDMPPLTTSSSGHQNGRHRGKG